MKRIKNERIKKVWIIIGACLTGALCLGGGIGIGWVIHKQDKLPDTSQDTPFVPAWLKDPNWHCDVSFHVDDAQWSGVYDLWFIDEGTDSIDLYNELILLTFPNDHGIQTSSTLSFHLTNFGKGFQTFEKSRLVGGEMDFGIMTPRSSQPVANTIKETITWIDNTPNSEKGIQDIDIAFQCNRPYTNTQIGLAESEFVYNE